MGKLQGKRKSDALKHKGDSNFSNKKEKLSDKKILTRSTSVVKSSVSKMPLPKQTKKCLSKSPKRGASGKVSPKLTRKLS